MEGERITLVLAQEVNINSRIILVFRVRGKEKNRGEWGKEGEAGKGGKRFPGLFLIFCRTQRKVVIP